ncbi:hypothetical protein DBR11_01970 [Pedobacter sp. HMWF019]|uniref:hypothetical protein n=1 Tax=Pedobacter sp. HMWF019 TaxID=2056856 RepID=UPI000D3CD331|nr:hypothetical protein [Pedobacter sp. HMWF019]PTT03537.1 hypothetical protein DBR11_01970 [Pedobacter sp. HMWF019]
MLKKKLHIALSTLLCCFTAAGSYAQATVTIPAVNITSQSDYTASAVPSGSSAALSVLGSITVKSSTANFPATTSGTSAPLALGVVHPKVNSIGGLNLLGAATEVQLSTLAQGIYTSVLGLGSGALTIDYRIAIAGTAWLAGTYATPLTFVNATPVSQNLSIVVPALLTLNTPVTTPTTMTVNALSAFRTGGGVSATNTFDYFSTVPTDVFLNSTSSTFSFSTTQLFNSTPVVPSGKLTALLSGAYAGPAISLSTAAQAISVSGSVPVVATNKNGQSNTLSISAADLKANFVQAGTYTLPIVYTIAKNVAAYPATLASITTSSSVQVTVAKMSELTIPASTVNFSFTTPAAYSQGLTVAMPNPITVSSTVPYGVTVKTSGNFISGANSIPAGVMIVEGTPSQTGISPVTLSTTATNLFNGSNPVIDRTINLQFRVPNTQTVNLLNKPAGTYNATVTFTIVAP